MILIITNYAVKILTIIVGIILLTGVFLPENLPNRGMMQIMGVILIIWGIYRLIIYRIQLNKYKIDGGESDEDN